jgi:hypothetical protein
MRTKNLLWLPALVVGLAIGGCTAEQTREGELPEVNVEGGQVPEYDVDPARVEVGQDTQQIVTPDVDVKPARPPE